MVEAANTVPVAVGEIDIENNINKAAASARILLTVWRKSLVMNSNGFTVYDSNGNLVFRVDDYCVSNFSNEVLLMDAAGKALMTIKRKRLILQSRWQGFLGDLLNDGKPVICIVGSSSFLRKKASGDVFLRSSKYPDFHIEGSVRTRTCMIYAINSGDIVAEMKRKQATAASNVMLGEDVFSLEVQPGYDQCLVMGLIISVDSILRNSIFCKLPRLITATKHSQESRLTKCRGNTQHFWIK